MSRLLIVPNGISLDDWRVGTESILRADVQKEISAARAAGCKIIGYAGSQGRANSLDNLLDAAALLLSEPVQFILVGDGHDHNRLSDRVQSEELSNVHMFPPIPKSQVPVFLAQVQAAYLGAPRLPIYRFGVSPNKMIDYMMAGVPILYSIESGNHPVEDAECGLTVQAENPNALASAIRELCSSSAERLLLMGENGKRYALNRHTYEVLAKSFLNTVKATLKK